MLLLLASMIGLGLIAGWATHGSLTGLKEIHFRLVWVLFASVIIALLPLFSDTISSHRRPIMIVTFAGVLIFIVVNMLTFRGELLAAILVVAAGWTLNFVVIASNGGMPLSLSAYSASGQTETFKTGSGGFYRVVIAGPSTRLRFLGDVIPVKIFREVVSIGDIFLILGIAFIIAAAMRTRRRRAPRVARPID